MPRSNCSFLLLLLWEIWYWEVMWEMCLSERHPLRFSLFEITLSCVFSIDPCCFEEASKESLLSVYYYFSRFCFLDEAADVLRRLHPWLIQFWPLRRVYRMNQDDRFLRSGKLFLRLSALFIIWTTWKSHESSLVITQSILYHALKYKCI